MKPLLLVADDEPAARAVVMGILHNRGYEMVAAENGEQALDLASRLRPDVILLDVMMPGLDGFEVCRRLKADGTLQHIPVLLITALDTREDLINGLEAGADEFLRKPVHGEELRARVRALLRIKSQYDQLQSAMEMRKMLSRMIIDRMRGPLGALLGHTEAISLAGGDSVDVTDSMNAIRGYALEQNRLLNDMLLMIQGDTGALEPERKQIDARQLLATALDPYATVARLRDIRFATDDGEAANVRVDPLMAERALDSLISYVVRTAEPGEEVTFAIRELAGPEPAVRFEVRTESTEKPELDPTGTPQEGELALCWAVSRAHGGRLRVDTDRQGHTTISFEL